MMQTVLRSAIAGSGCWRTSRESRRDVFVGGSGTQRGGRGGVETVVVENVCV